jgi:hypothetical protein
MEKSDDTFDTILQDIIDGVTDAMEEETNLFFVVRTQTEVRTGDGTATILVPGPIESLSSIDNNGVTVDVADDTEVQFDAATGEVELMDGSVWSTVRRSVTITYGRGYQRSQIPRSAIMAAEEWCVWEFQKRTKDRVGVQSITKGDETVSYSDDLPRSITRRIGGMRVSTFGAE